MRTGHGMTVGGLALLAAVTLAAGPGIGQATPARHEQGHDERAAREADELGAVDFRVSCDPGVQADFDRAVALLHHMMYQDSRAAFRAISEADPDCAMAYWGVATTLFQPLWGTRPGADELEEGRRLTRKARELEPPTERERLLVEATAGFFRDAEADAFWDRLHRWIDGMAEAYEAAPEDPDVAALYALSRLTAAQVADDRAPIQDEAEEILRDVWEREPTHPGAIHYTIHATDADGRAENALDIVERYGEVAPAVPHALHMPSHIYVRLGDWSRVIEWNLRSAEAALEHPVGEAVSHHYLHALDYLVYAHLQQGRDDSARAAYDRALAEDTYQGTFVSAFHRAAMPARIAVERRAWDDARALEPRVPEYLPWDESVWAESLTWFARGLGGVHGGDTELAREAEGRLRQLRDRARGRDEDAFATYIEVDRRILAGWLAREEGDDAEAVRLIRSAAELEDTVEKHPVTPGALSPPYEALGDLLMDLGRPAEALDAYRASDETWPARFNTVLGAARAAAAAGEPELARQQYGRVLEIAGDSERPEVAEARRFVEG